MSDLMLFLILIAIVCGIDLLIFIACIHIVPTEEEEKEYLNHFAFCEDFSDDE